MEKSEDIKELATALSKAQGEMGGASKDAANPFFKSKYADLGSVVHALKQPFADNGLSYSQFPIAENDRVGVETILMHKSGQWLSNSVLFKPTKQDVQGAGSVITYARRYSLQALAGIPSEDDDGTAASAPAKARVVTADDQGWINAINAKTSKLEEITDPAYREFIKGKLK
ncbi:MAG: single-stranded DNA-binding protein [Alphaproteobacteria bacterium]|nr:MAG: single-stranded DNA-binding protein [Alphaproteobacteria bacterium]